MEVSIITGPSLEIPLLWGNQKYISQVCTILTCERNFAIALEKVLEDLSAPLNETMNMNW